MPMRIDIDKILDKYGLNIMISIMMAVGFVLGVLVTIVLS